VVVGTGSSTDRINVITEPAKKKEDKFYFYWLPYSRKVTVLKDWIKEKVDTRKEESVLFAHADIEGMWYNEWVRCEMGLDPEILEKKFRYAFVGHFHKMIRHKENVISVGATHQHNFGERNYKVGCWIWDSSNDKLEFIENTKSPRFYAFDLSEGEKIPSGCRKTIDFYRIQIPVGSKIPDEVKGLKWKRVSFVGAKNSSRKKGTISFKDKNSDLLGKYVNVKVVGKEYEKKKLLKIGMEYL